MDATWIQLTRGIEPLDRLGVDQRRHVARRAVGSAVRAGSWRLAAVRIAMLTSIAGPWVMFVALLVGGVKIRSAPWLVVFTVLGMVMTATILGTLVVALAVAVRRLIRWHVQHYVCPACAYPLVGLEPWSGNVTCPECGREFPDELRGVDCGVRL